MAKQSSEKCRSYRTWAHRGDSLKNNNNNDDDDDDDDDGDDDNNNNNNNDNDNDDDDDDDDNNNSDHSKAQFEILYYLLTAPRTVSNTLAQVAQAQLCVNHVQHIERLSRATCCVPRGKKGQLSLFDRVEIEFI